MQSNKKQKTVNKKEKRPELLRNNNPPVYQWLNNFSWVILMIETPTHITTLRFA